MNAHDVEPFDGLAAMVFGIDADGIVRSVNEAAAAALGRSRADVVGTRFGEFARADTGAVTVFDTADGARLSAVVARSTSAPDGLQWLTAIPVGPPDENQDAKLAALGGLAHHVVHELNQPLSVIRMAIGTTRRRLTAGGEIDAGFIDSKLERMDSQCVRAAAIVECMRVFVPRNRTLNVALEVNRAVENAVAMTAPRFRKLNVEVGLQLGDAVQVLGNEMHIEPALLCVLGEIHDRVAAAGHERPAGVTVRTAAVGSELVEIVLSDAAGPSTADASAPSSVSLGMGRTLAESLAVELGGRLDVSPGDAGMTYRFSLPASRDAGA